MEVRQKIHVVSIFLYFKLSKSLALLYVIKNNEHNEFFETRLKNVVNDVVIWL